MNGPCRNMQDKLADYVLGVLSDLEVDALREHLRGCPACTEYVRVLQEQNRLLVRLGEELTSDTASREDKVIEALNRSASTVSIEPISLWRSIMKSRIIKLTAAAVIIVAVLIGIHQFGSSVESVTFADVVQPFLTASTATFKGTVKVEGGPTQSFEGMFMEPALMRQTNAEGATVICDLQQGKIMTLLPTQKLAVIFEMVNTPEGEDQSQFNLFHEIRRRLQETQATDDESVEFLGEQEIDGLAVIGYHVEKPGVDITVWADAKTLLPVRLESTTGPMTYIMSDIVFDVEMDKALFDLKVPEGYTIQTLQMDGSEPTERDLLEMFRIWTEHMDGKFPSTLDANAPMEFVKYQQKKMKEQGQEPSEQEMMEKILGMQQTMMKMSRGFAFVQQLPPESDWHYVGKDATFGGPDTPIFWYRPEGSETCRVVYADLTVADVKPDELPEVPQSQPRSKDSSQESAVLEKATKMGADIPADKRNVVARMLSLNEKDLILGLRAFAELSDGRYPSKLDSKTTITEMDSLGENWTGIPKNEQEAKAQDIFFASVYYEKLVSRKKDVGYYGDKVTAKDGNKVLMRWKISDDEYRAIFGDLTIKKIPAERLTDLEKPSLE